MPNFWKYCTRYPENPDLPEDAEYDNVIIFRDTDGTDYEVPLAPGQVSSQLYATELACSPSSRNATDNNIFFADPLELMLQAYIAHSSILNNLERKLDSKKAGLPYWQHSAGNFRGITHIFKIHPPQEMSRKSTELCKCSMASSMNTMQVQVPADCRQRASVCMY